LYNGKPWQANFRKVIGFVEQDDIVISSLTVRQSLTFTARLRLPGNWSMQRKRDRVDGLIASLNLDKCADTKIESISGGERKRLCIALECIVQPQLLLLDEPTSGLDSTTAVHVVKLLRELSSDTELAPLNEAKENSTPSDSGKIRSQKSLRVHQVGRGVTVACTIHQPSSQIFNLFDDLLFVDNGDIVYFGPVRQLCPTLTSVGFEVPSHYNPADYMMDIISLGEVDASTKQELIAIHNKSAESSLHLRAKQLPGVHDSSVVAKTDVEAQWRSTNYMEQVLVLAERQLLMAWPQVWTWPNFFSFIVQTFLAGVLWYPVRNDFSEDAIFSRMSFVFWTVGTWTFFPLFGCLHLFHSHLNKLRKELSVSAYSLHAYFTAVTTILIPMDLFWTLLYLPITFAMVNVAPSASIFFAFAGSVWLTILVMQAVGLAIGASFLGSPNAFIFSISLVTFMFGYGGLFVSLEAMEWVANLRYINLLRYCFQLSMNTVYGELGNDFNYTCSDSGVSNFPQCLGDNSSAATINGTEILQFFSIPADSVVVSLSVLFGAVIVLRCVSYGALHLHLWNDGTLDNRYTDLVDSEADASGAKNVVGLEMVSVSDASSNADTDETAVVELSSE